jgi:hypothetical protein
MSSTPAPDRTSIASEALHRHPTTGAEPIADEPQAPAALQSAPTAVQAEPSFIGRTSIAHTTVASPGYGDRCGRNGAAGMCAEPTSSRGEMVVSRWAQADRLLAGLWLGFVGTAQAADITKCVRNGGSNDGLYRQLPPCRVRTDASVPSECRSAKLGRRGLSVRVALAWQQPASIRGGRNRCFADRQRLRRTALEFTRSRGGDRESLRGRGGRYVAWPFTVAGGCSVRVTGSARRRGLPGRGFHRVGAGASRGRAAEHQLCPSRRSGPSVRLGNHHESRRSEESVHRPICCGVRPARL